MSRDADPGDRGQPSAPGLDAAVSPPHAAALFIARSEVIAESLQLGIAANRAALAPSPRRGPDAP